MRNCKKRWDNDETSRFRKVWQEHGLKLITIADLAEYKKSVMKSSNQRKGRGAGRDSSPVHARL